MIHNTLTTITILTIRNLTKSQNKTIKRREMLVEILQNIWHLIQKALIYISTVNISLQYNGFYRNDIIFSPWNHDAITWTCFDDGI